MKAFYGELCYFTGSYSIINCHTELNDNHRVFFNWLLGLVSVCCLVFGLCLILGLVLCQDIAM